MFPRRGGARKPPEIPGPELVFGDPIRLRAMPDTPAPPDASGLPAAPGTPGDDRAALTGTAAGARLPDGTDAEARVGRLQAELDRTRERLRMANEEHEATVEELRASNEELQSVNEEYHSATEQLETSREELQSVNEELETVNGELKAHADEVTRVHADLQHLMASTEIGTLFVDRDLRVQRYTPRVATLFDMGAGDRGRPLAHVTHRLHDVDLTADAADVLASLQPAEREVRTHDGETYLVRIRPYRTVDDRIEGVVLTFVDVTERVRAEAAMRESEARLRLATGSGGVGVGIWDLATGRLTGDARLAFLYGLDEAEVTSPEGTDSAALFARVHPDDRPELEVAAAREIETGAGGYSVEYRALGADGAWRCLLVHAAVERSPEGEPLRFAGAVLDVTERSEAEAALRESEVRFRTLFETIDEGFALCEMILDEAGEATSYRFLDANPAFKAMTGLDVVGKTVAEIVPGEEAAWVARFAPAALRGETVRFEESANALGQTFSVYASPATPAGRFTQVFSDVTAQRAAAVALEADARRSAFRVALADALRPLTDAAAIQDETARLLGEHLGSSRAFYVEVDPDGNGGVVARDFTAGVASVAGRYRLADYSPAFGDAYRAGQTVAVADVATDARPSGADRVALAALGIGAFVAAPLVRDGCLVAILGLHQSTPRAWTPAEVALVEEVGERAWATIEQARAEAAVRESEAHARLALDIAAIGSWTWEPAGETMTADARTGEICGLPSGQPLPVADVLARVHGDDRPRIAAALAAALDPDGDGRYAEDLRFVHPDGSVRWTVARGQMRFDVATRAPAGFAGTVLDVTDREASAAAVRESGERLRLLVEGAREYAFLGMDTDGRITTWSAGAERIFGWTEAEIAGETVRLIFTPEDQAAGAPQREMAGARANGHAPDERWHVRKSGERFWGSGTVNALRDAAGTLQGYAKVLRDNTKRRADEQALIDSESRFRRAVEAAAVPVMLHADDGEVLAVSDAVVEITGYARGEVETMGAWAERAYTPDAAAAMAAVVAEHFAGRRAVRPFEADIRTATGDVRTWVFSAGAPETLRDGRLFYASFASDVTERKRAEAALVALNATLDARVTERTQALAERTEQARALAGALTLAEQRERHRIAGVLHDHVQQLLYGVQIKLQLLPRAAPETVPTVTGEISALVGEALRAARSLTVELSPPVLSGEGLTAALRWLATQMEETHGLRVAVSATGDGPPLSEERRVLVFQLVRELLFNVVKHAGVDEARVSVDEAPGRLTVCVEDDGAGFRRPADAFGEDGPPDAAGPGGFGLVSLRQRLGPLGGRLAIEALPGKGTRVVIHLPL